VETWEKRHTRALREWEAENKHKLVDDEKEKAKKILDQEKATGSGMYSKDFLDLYEREKLLSEIPSSNKNKDERDGKIKRSLIESSRR